MLRCPRTLVFGFGVWQQLTGQRSPRACGGSPSRHAERRRALVSPRVRGFAPGLRTRHAGLRGRVASRLGRSPRACGGSPLWSTGRSGCNGLPARAGVRPPAQISRQDPGLPARAGVRPGRPWRSTSPWRSPRACGGSPGIADVSAAERSDGLPARAGVRPTQIARTAVEMVSPRVRGFAQRAGSRQPDADGLPARAGVRPPAGADQRARGLPARAGVRPSTKSESYAGMDGVSPRVRGFAHQMPRADRATCHGLPARAGVRPWGWLMVNASTSIGFR